MTLDRLNRVNDVRIFSVYDDKFRLYGRVIGRKFTDICAYMAEHTDIPAEGNVYVPSVEAMERGEEFDWLKDVLYGGMPIQIGYCNGKNSTYNGFEYHKGSEVNVAVTDFMLALGHTYQIEDNKFYVGNETVFYVPQGVAIEMYQTTLHLSPLRVRDEGFKAAVVLPKGTNTPLARRPEGAEAEAELLFMTNKWVIAHAERKPLVSLGAHIGLIGENKELKY